MPRVHYENIRDEEGNLWRADDRLWQSVFFVNYIPLQELRGGGNSIPRGIGDRVLNLLGQFMVNQEIGCRALWIPAVQMTDIAIHMQESTHWHQILGAMHGTLRGFFLWQRHWCLLEPGVKGTVLQVHYWHGLIHAGGDQIRQLAETIKDSMVIPTVVTNYEAKISQLYSDTCGAVALLHLV